MWAITSGPSVRISCTRIDFRGGTSTETESEYFLTPSQFESYRTRLQNEARVLLELIRQGEGISGPQLDQLELTAEAQAEDMYDFIVEMLNSGFTCEYVHFCLKDVLPSWLVEERFPI